MEEPGGNLWGWEAVGAEAVKGKGIRASTLTTESCGFRGGLR